MNETDLIIDGITMPALKFNGLKITREKIWSSNTGRAANGETIGDIVAIKYKLHCEWPPLTRADVVILDAAVTPAFFNVTFLDPATNQQKTIRCYAGTPTYPVYSYYNGVKTYAGVSVDLIEK